MRNVIIIFITLLLNQVGFAQDKIKFTEIRPPYKSISPAISRMQNLNSDTLTVELNKFWEKAKKNGLPLIERDSLYEDYLYITLIYQDTSKNKDISFDVYGIYDEYRFGDMKMHRLKNTDLLYRCYMVPNDICFSYRFRIKDTLSGNTINDIDMYNADRIPTGLQNNYSYSVLDLRKNETDWNAKRYESTGSKLDTFIFESNIMSNSRNIYVYLPSGYNQKSKEKYPIIYLFDSFIYLNRVEVPNILDNMIKEGKIESMIAVLIDNPTNTSRNIELPNNFEFKRFIIEELVPNIRQKYNTSINPTENIIGGISYGGLAASFIAFYHPNIFGKVLSQSGGLWRDKQLTDLFGNEIRNDWIINQYIRGDKKKIKIFLDWGLQENMVLGANRKMVRILDKKGYDFKFVEFNGWHDWSNSRKTFPVGLMYLLND